MTSQKRLVPYSVYLDEETHEALREKAKSRQASKLVRQAITMILDGGDDYSSGYAHALRDMSSILQSDVVLNDISFKDEKLADYVVARISFLESGHR